MSSKNILEKNDKLFLYYNLKYSQVGGIFRSKKRAIQFLCEENQYLSPKKISKCIDNNGEYSDYICSLKLIPFSHSNEKNPSSLYVLRYPEMISDKKDVILKEGLRFVINRYEKYNGNTFEWKHKIVELTPDWYSLILKKPIDSLCLDSLNIKELKTLWTTLVEENSWNDPNHFEIVNTFRIFL